MTMIPNGRVVLFLWLFVAAANARGDDWPTFQHDNQRSGVTEESLRPPLLLAWTFRSPFPPAKGWSLPVNGYGARKNKPNVSQDDAYRVIAVDDTCFFCSSAEHKVYALDTSTGEVRWQAFTGAAPRLAPAYWQGRVYVGADDGVFRCLDAADGSPVWEINAAPRTDLMLGYGRFTSLWPIRSAGIVDEGIAYFTAGLFPQNGIYLYAARAEDGTVLWRRRLDGGGLEAICPQGHILASPDSLWLTSRVAPTRWSKSDGSPIDFHTPFPEIEDSHEYRFYNGGADARLRNNGHIVYGQACILGYDPDVGLKDKWGKSRRGDLRFNWFGARQITFRRDIAYVATDEHLLAVDQRLLPELSQQECRQYELAYKRLRIASYLDHLEGYQQLVEQSGEEDPRAVAIASGPLKWGRDSWEKWSGESQAILDRLNRRCAWMTPLVATEAMILAGDTVYAGGEDRVVALAASDGEVLWSAETGSRVRGLAAANGRLFVSTIDGNVRCYSSDRNEGTQESKTAPSGNGQRELGRREAKLLDLAREHVATDHGYALVFGDETGMLASRLVRDTQMRIEIVVSEPATVSHLRRRLSQAGLYGGRVCVREADSTSYAPYLFDLVIDLPSGKDGEPSVPLDELFRLTKPCGGVTILANGRESRPAAIAMELENAELVSNDEFLIIRRGRLPRSKDWTHNYATAANTYCSEDPLVRGPFGVLWYGEPGPQKRIERHATPPMPLVAGGVMFTIGYDLVMAYDVYNGVPLWEREIRGATRTSLPINTSNLVADEQSLFVVIDNRECLRLDARTGRTLQTYDPPTRNSGGPATWGWIARDGDLLFGSSADWDPGRRQAAKQTSHAVFAMDIHTGETAWIHRSEGIDHNGIAIAEGSVFLIDGQLTGEERRQALADTIVESGVPDRKAVDRRGNAIEPDVRRLVVLDAATGRKRWQKPWNMTDITLDDTVVQGRGGVACMVKSGVLVVHGTGSLGHPHREFLAGEFARRALYAFDAATGEYLWGGRKGYRKRPIIVGDYVYAEPFGWRLKTGQIKTTPSPLSGEPQVFDFHRGYIGCGHLLGSADTLFGARGGVAYWNLDQQTGFTPFAGMALACGLGAVPAGGVFAVPEGRSGCTCDVPIHTSIAFYPKPDSKTWSLGTTGGLAETVALPVQNVSINLGAPGLREDHDRRLWIPYPTRVGLGVIGDWLPTYQHDSEMCFRLDDLTTRIEGTEQPWIFTSGYCHDKPLRFHLTESADSVEHYTVRLYFSEPEDLAAGDRVFSVRLQGQTVLEDLDIVRATGGPRRALIREFSGIKVAGDLVIELAPSDGDGSKQPILSGFQAIRHGT